MPFLNDQELESLRNQIKELNSKNEELENELSEKTEEVVDIRSVARNRNILLSTLAGVCIAIALVIYNTSGNDTSSLDIISIKKAEAYRVIDSINTAYENDYKDDDGDENSLSIDEKIASIKDEIKDEVVYSVQITAFSEQEFPLLSKTIMGSLSKDDNFYRYSIGLFSTLQEAQDFRRELLKFGFKDAFVASYIDGKRQKIENPY